MATPVDFEDAGIGEAISEYRLKVPVNQRPYKWEEEHVLDLFSDLENAIATDQPEYFLGTMVFIRTASRNDKELEVADGQQRLATIIIFMAAIRDYLFPDTSQEKLIADVKKKYLASFDMEVDDDRPILTLSDEDNDFFRRRIIADPGSVDRLNEPHSRRQSHNAINLAAELAAKQVAKIVDTPNPAHRIARLKQWITFIRTAARIVVVIVPDPSKAFTIFETLNDRGLKLSQVDLLKNYLYGLASQGHRLGEAQRMWQEMYGALEASGYERLALDYIRQLWISYNGHVTEDELFDEIKEFAKSPSKAIELTGMLSSNATTFTATLNPSHPYWSEFTDPTKRAISVIVNNLKVDRIRPLFLSILAKFNKKDVEKSFRLCVSWTVRFLIVGGIGSGTIEKFYASAAQKVRSGELAEPQAIADEMQKHVANDNQFENAFAKANVSRSYLARYYLHVLDRLVKDKGTPSAREASLAIDDESERHDLEHVIPPRLMEGQKYPLDDETRLELVNRLGNQAIIEKPLNSTLRSAPFDKKKPEYQKSTFILTQKLSKLKVDIFDRAQVDARQIELAQLAVKAWPIKVAP